MLTITKKKWYICLNCPYNFHCISFPVVLFPFPNVTGCPVPPKSYLLSSTNSTELWDGNDNTCVSPYAAMGNGSYRILIELLQLWRAVPVIQLKGSSFPCDPKEGISVTLLTSNGNNACYLWAFPSGSAGSCYYKCDQVTATVNYISVDIRKELPNLQLCKVSVSSVQDM